MTWRARVFVVFLIWGTLMATAGQSQVVKFRLETTDLAGLPIESVVAGDDFLLQVHTQHVGGFAASGGAGVFAGYLDVRYDPSLATVAGSINHGSLYSNGKSGDLSVPGLLNDMGGFSSSGEQGIGIDPIGRDEQFLLSLPMRAVGPGTLEIVGSETLHYPQHDVLVYGQNVPVPARDIDFGSADLRVDFGAVSLNVLAVPEPPALGGLLLGWAHLLVVRRFRRSRLPGRAVPAERE